MRTVSIRTSLLLSLLLLIVALAGTLLAATWIGRKQGVETVSRELIENRSMLVSAKLERLLHPVHQTLALLGQWGRSGEVLEPTDTARLNALFISLCREIPQVSSVNTGDADGNGYLLLRRPGGRWHNRIVRRQAWGDRTRWEEWTSSTLSGTTRVRTWEKKLDYDPRQRPWYTLAAERSGKGPAWSEPYTFATTGQRGITASIRVMPQEGRPVRDRLRYPARGPHGLHPKTPRQPAGARPDPLSDAPIHRTAARQVPRNTGGPRRSS